MSERTAYPPSVTESESKPVRALYAVAAVAVAAPSALAVIPGVPGWLAGAVGAVGLLLTIGLGRYTQGQVTPTEDVAVKRIRTEEGRKYVAAPALPGVIDGTVLNKPTPVAGAEPGGFLPHQLGDRPLDPFEEDLNNG